jgi:hypothetical protein
MKKNNLSVPLLMTASLASIIALNMGCGKNSAANPESPATPDGGSNTVGNANSNATGAMGSNVVAVESAKPSALVPHTDITNPPAAVTTTPAAPATPEPAPTAPAVKSHTKVVEMSTTVPQAPKKFYSQDFVTNRCCASTTSDYYFAVRAGYEHSGYAGDNSDTWYAGIKFYAHPNHLRAKAGKNAWLIPDADAELAHHFLAKPDSTANPGNDEGIRFRASFYWSWVNWTTKTLSRENCACPFAQPLHFAIGPVFSTGFDKTFDGSGFRFARYGGARLSVNRYAFVQYTFGKTDGFASHNSEFSGELPFYISHDQQVRYVIRGEWARGSSGTPDYYQLGAFAEMPLSLVVRPREWHDLIPFAD